MKVIGITGPTGAGKTSALRAIEELGGVIIDADAVYHDLTMTSRPMREELCARFGEVYIGDTLDRKKLGAIVFQDDAALNDLNAITHKYVDEETVRLVEEARREKRPAAIDAFGLLESPLIRHCDCTVAVVAPDELRIQRIMKRDGITEEYARMRIAAQKDSKWYSEHCDYTLVNDVGDTSATFTARAYAFFKELLEEESLGKGSVPNG